MEQAQIKKIISNIKNLVQDIESPYREIAFRVLLELSLSELLKKDLWKKETLTEESISKAKETQAKKIYEGLTGGLLFLIDNGFFNEPKTLNQIFDELRRNAYHYPKTSLPKALFDLIRKKKQLTRIFGNDKRWRYVIRK